MTTRVSLVGGSKKASKRAAKKARKKIQQEANPPACPIKPRPRTRRCRTRVGMVAWARTNCNGSIHYVGLNTRGRLVFRDHAVKDLYRAARLYEAGGGSSGACTCANFFRAWVLGVFKQIPEEFFPLARERVAWNSYVTETKDERPNCVRPDWAVKVAQRLLSRKRRERGVQPPVPRPLTVGRKTSPTGRTERRNAKNRAESAGEGVGDAAVDEVFDYLCDRLVSLGVALRYVHKGPDKDSAPEESDYYGKLIRPSVPLLRLHNSIVYVKLPKIRGSSKSKASDDPTLPKTVWVRAFQLSQVGGLHPHCRVSIWGRGSPEVVIKPSDGPNWDFEYLAAALETRIALLRAADWLQWRAARDHKDLGDRMTSVSESLQLPMKLERSGPDSRMRATFTVEIGDLTLQGAYCIGKALQAVKDGKLAAVLSAARRRLASEYRFPEPPGWAPASDPREKAKREYDPRDKFD